MIVELQQILNNIHYRGLGLTITDLKKICLDHHLSAALAEVELVENDYSLLVQFFANGFEDTQREEVYRRLERRLYSITSSLMVDCVADQNPAFKQSRSNALRHLCDYESIEETLSGYVSELALASLDSNPEEKQREIHQRLLQYRIFLFDFIFTSKPWSQSEASVMEKLLLSPLVDVIDQQIILSAMLMAQRMVFDAWKFHTLCRISALSTQVLIRQRAIVGVAFGLPESIDLSVNKDLIESSLDELMSVEGMKQTFCDLQTQVFHCMDTTSNEETINNDILPTLMKGGQNMIDRQNTKNNYIDNILHPDKEEKEMETLESAVERMRKMQENGADIFFGGFSKAKRFSFFYTLMNWFCPFYIEHPQVMSTNLRDVPMAFLAKIVDGQYFCNSDKYSFILSLAHVISQIPKDMLEMMKQGEVAPAFEDKTTNVEAFTRRAYLNDLYRFFYLYTDKAYFSNPFAKAESASFFLHRLMKKYFFGTIYPLRIGRQMLRRRFKNELNTLVNIYNVEDNSGYIKLLALNYEMEGDYTLAISYYNKLLLMEPDNLLILQHTANCCFLDGIYQDALECYEKFLELSQKDDDYDVEYYRVALCHIEVGEIEEGMKILFRLSYNHPEEELYLKAIAGGYMREHKFQEALNIYDKIDDENMDHVGFACKAISLWILNRIGESVACLSKLVKSEYDNGQSSVIDIMIDELNKIGLLEEYRTEIFILIDLAFKQ